MEICKTMFRLIQDMENPFLKYVGKLPYFRSMEEIDAWTREMRDEADDPVTAAMLRRIAERENR